MGSKSFANLIMPPDLVAAYVCFDDFQKELEQPDYFIGKQQETENYGNKGDFEIILCWEIRITLLVFRVRLFGGKAYEYGFCKNP